MVIPSRVDSHNRLKPYRPLANQSTVTRSLDDPGFTENDAAVVPGGDESDGGEHEGDQGSKDNLKKSNVSSPPLDDCDKKSPSLRNRHVERPMDAQLGAPK